MKLALKNGADVNYRDKVSLNNNTVSGINVFNEKYLINLIDTENSLILNDISN